MTQLMTKNRIIDEFKIMKYLEISARDYYLQICSDQSIKSDKIRALFKNFADEKTRHIHTIQNIIELITSRL